MRRPWVSAGILLLWAGSCGGQSERRVANGDDNDGGSSVSGTGGITGIPSGGAIATGGTNTGGRSQGTGGASQTGGLPGKGGFPSSGGAVIRGGFGGDGGTAGTNMGGTGAMEGGVGGIAGEGACACEVRSAGTGMRAICEVPMESVCCSSDERLCWPTLDGLLSNLDLVCGGGTVVGTRMTCRGGRTIVWWRELSLSSEQRLVFDEAGRLVGKWYFGYECPHVYRDICEGETPVDETGYSSGNLETGACTPVCSLCSDDGLPSCRDGAGGQGGLGG